MSPAAPAQTQGVQAPDPQAGLSLDPVAQQIADSEKPGIVSQAATGIRDAVHGAAEDYRSKQPTMERDRAVKNFFAWIKPGSTIIPNKTETANVLKYYDSLTPEQKAIVEKLAVKHGLVK